MSISWNCGSRERRSETGWDVDRDGAGERRMMLAADSSGLQGLSPPPPRMCVRVCCLTTEWYVHRNHACRKALWEGNNPDRLVMWPWKHFFWIRQKQLQFSFFVTDRFKSWLYSCSSFFPDEGKSNSALLVCWVGRDSADELDPIMVSALLYCISVVKWCSLSSLSVHVHHRHKGINQCWLSELKICYFFPF